MSEFAPKPTTEYLVTEADTFAPDGVTPRELDPVVAQDKAQKVAGLIERRQGLEQTLELERQYSRDSEGTPDLSTVNALEDKIIQSKQTENLVYQAVDSERRTEHDHARRQIFGSRIVKKLFHIDK